jgi:integrase
MRAGHVFKRCGQCGTRIADRRCSKCGGDDFTWAFRVDVARAGEPRAQKGRGGFSTKAAALAAMAGLQTAKADGTYIEPSRLTLGAYLDQWLAAGCGGVRPWTLKGYASVVANHIKPRLGTVPLQKLTRPELKAFYAALRTGGYTKGRKAGSGLSEKSVYNVHIALRAALNDAIEDELMRTNPAAGALKPPGQGAEMATWNREDLAAFLESLRDEPDFALYRIAAYTGLRRGELLGLRWSDVKWNLSSLAIQQQLGLDDDGDGERDLAPVKTGNGRRAISLDAETLRILEEHRRQQEFGRRSWGDAYKALDLVFCHHDGSPLDPDTVTSQFGQAVARSGVRRIRLHDVRHTHATLLLEAGVDISVVSRRLGHADVGFTARVYAHVTARLQLDAAARLSAYLEPVTATR